MRIICFLISFICLSAGLSDYCMAEAVLHGKTVLNRIGGESVKGAKVSAFGTTDFLSTETGKFVLKFPEINPGDAVEFQCEKDGIEVVNDMDLETILMRVPRPITILMCIKGERDKYAADYYRIRLAEIIEDSFKEELKQINENYRISLEEKNRGIARLTEENEKAGDLSKEWAEKFAAVRLNQASELYKEAYRYFLEGKIDEAIEDSVDLPRY